jgi:hypothetical protein
VPLPLALAAFWRVAVIGVVALADIIGLLEETPVIQSETFFQ